MADENTARSYRSPDAVRRAGGSPKPAEQAQGGDPLAELARLIGQSDPFAEFGPKGSRGEPQAAAGGVPDWRKTAAAMPAYEIAPEREESREPQFASSQPLPRDGHQDSQGYADSRHYGEAHDDGHRVGYGEPRAEYAGQDPHQRETEDRQFAASERSDVRADSGTRAGNRQEPENEPYYDDGAPLAPEDQDLYDDAPRSRRRSGAIMAVTLIACAMLGTAGAYGYRTYYTGPSAPKVPPVIQAEGTPSKIVPSTEGQAAKVIQDRVQERGSPERVVSREEQPVDVQIQTAPTPRVVLPSPVAPAPSQAQASGQQGTSPGTEPKRVRTVTIRPDGTDLSGRPVGGLAGASAQQPTNPTLPRTTAAPKSAPPPVARNNGGPLSLDPQAQASATPPPPTTRERVAAVPPTSPPPPFPQATPPPPAPRQAALPTTSPGGSGGYLVQLSSQKSESEAQASFRSMQARFPNQLRGQSPVIKRADLGPKGVYYRAMVGPFASSGEADQFCGSLKAAGGQCLIQRN